MKKECKQYIGIVSTVILTMIFIAASKIGAVYFKGAAWYFFSSLLRLIFGCVAIFLLNKFYGRSLKDIFSNYSPKAVFISGLGFAIYALYFIIAISLGYFPVKITGLTLPLFLSHIILQQVTTGFCEEALNRGLLLEGYFSTGMSRFSKVTYALISFLLFGLIHVTSGWDTYMFFYTGIVGFSFATIYLNTHNLIIPMIMHFVYDIFANIVHYMEFNESVIFNTFYSVNVVMVGIMFAVSLVMLLKDKTASKEREQQEEIYCK